MFQCLINDVLRETLGRYAITYIVDLLMYSKSYDEHISHVKSVLAKLWAHQLYVKGEKCEFHVRTVKFLGYIISPNGVEMEESKVKAIREWSRPKMVKEMQPFLGFANFYRRFIRSFSCIAVPLTSLLKKVAHALI